MCRPCARSAEPGLRAFTTAVRCKHMRDARCISFSMGPDVKRTPPTTLITNYYTSYSSPSWHEHSSQTELMKGWRDTWREKAEGGLSERLQGQREAGARRDEAGGRGELDGQREGDGTG
ncbi:unnamed protein product [Pleuronectes platessa]|uniref:Uncharacterized protein n=1 Tax=Pleuronectes platessa TaxID=8262 RepID=A0A9N7VAU0_PLEPL|nr:unnamed protein product [Pleuronectes platessa]